MSYRKVRFFVLAALLLVALGCGPGGATSEEEESTTGQQQIAPSSPLTSKQLELTIEADHALEARIHSTVDAMRVEALTSKQEESTVDISTQVATPTASEVGPDLLHLGWTWPVDDTKTAGRWVTAGDDGRIYPMDSTGTLHALLPSGEELWRFHGDYDWATQAAISQDTQVLYFLTDSQELYAVDVDGVFRWKRETPFSPAWMPLVAPDGAVYFTGETDAVRISPDGKSESDFAWPDATSAGSAVFDGEGRLYAPSRVEVWVYSAQGEKEAACPWDDHQSDLVGMKGGGFVYATTNGQVHAVDPKCDRMWSYPATEGVGGYELVATTENGAVFAMRQDGQQMLVLDEGGTLLWEVTPEGTSQELLYLAAGLEGGVSAVDRAGTVKLFDAEGRLVWSHTPYFAGRPGPPASAGAGLAFIHGGKLYYFTGDPTLAQPEPTPASPPADAQAAKAEIVAFVVDFILEQEIRGTAEYIRAEAQGIVPGPPEACIIVWKEDGSLKKAWWYTDQDDTLVEREDMQAAIDQYREKYIERARSDIFAYGSYDFTIESVSEDRLEATVNVGASCGPLCGHGVRYTLLRSLSGEWWIADSELLWQS